MFPTRFCVSYGNHGSGIHVEDILTYARNALRIAGQEAYLQPALLRDGVNVLLESFTPAQALQIQRLKRHTKARFVVLVTEFTNGRTFNSHISSGAGHYVDAALWQLRFDTFLQVADNADAVWVLAHDSLPEYQSVLRHKPVLPFPIGFDSLLPTAHHAPPERKDIDWLFTGSETPHRKAILDALGARHYLVRAPVTTPNAARIDLIARAKATLHINLSEDQLHSSVMRHHFLLMNQSPVVSERAKFSGPLDAFITQFDAKDVVADLDAFLRSGAWRTAGTAAYDQYRKALPLAPRMNELLTQSGII